MFEIGKPNFNTGSSDQLLESPQDIRAACQSAQGRIMRLQQATNNQVGLTSAIRDGWFEELRHVAQCFISAQQASAKIEQAMNTDRNQLQGALSAALNERDLRTSERDAAIQEVQFLRAKLNEFTSKMQNRGLVSDIRVPFTSANTTNSNYNTHQMESSNYGTRAKCENWIMTGDTSTTSPIGGSPEEDRYAVKPTNGHQQPRPAVVESSNLLLDEAHSGSHNRLKTFDSFSSAKDEGPDHSQYFKAAVPAFPSNGYSRNSQSKFFGKNGGSMIHHNPAGRLDSTGTGTPDLGSGNGLPRFAQTPASSSHGPFAPPPFQQPNKRPAAEFSERARNGPSMPSTVPPPASTTSGSGQLSVAPKQPRFPQPIQPAQHLSPRPSTPTPMRNSTTGKELALVRDTPQVSAVFAPGVAPQSGSADEDRVRDIFDFFNTIKEWVDKYCSVPNIDAVHSMSRQFPRLWDYACSVTYPNNRHNAASHSTFMLCNRNFRPYFIARLLIQYVVQQMWSPQAWEGLDEKLTDILVGVKHRLDLKYGYDAVLQPQERHALVEKRSRAIYEFMRQPTWNKYKSQKINQAATRFKDIVGPMMNMEHIDHQSAVHDLTGICEGALRLSAILNTSRLSFQFIFNECGIKFSDQSHRPLNTNMPARELQAHHWRLMCVVTPGITYRNDAGSSVDPRFLAKANVLLMQ